MKASLSKKQYEEALKNISLYPLPVFVFNGEEFVRLEHAMQLKEFADDALGLRKKKEKI